PAGDGVVAFGVDELACGAEAVAGGRADFVPVAALPVGKELFFESRGGLPVAVLTGWTASPCAGLGCWVAAWPPTGFNGVAVAPPTFGTGLRLGSTAGLSGTEGNL